MRALTLLRRPRALALLLGLVVVAGPLLFAARPAQAATTYTVTTVGDNPDAAQGDGRCDTTLATTSAPCSLRAAIQEANATTGADTIAFAIPGGGQKTIRPGSALPAITEQVTINGYSQPGATPNTATTGTNAQLRIELDGTNAGFEANGLDIRGSNTLVRGLVVNRFGRAGIFIAGGATGVQTAGCFLGTDAAGTGALGNHYGVHVFDATGTRLGGPTPAARNLVSGDANIGVFLETGASGTRLVGNLIGTDRTGTAPLGNDAGVVTRAPSAVIGGDTAAQANVIAFSDLTGVAVLSPGTGHRILRNSIFANDGLGIDLGGNGVTANDPQDPDTGPNALQNFPVIATATSTSVTGALNSTPNQDFALRLFSNPAGEDEGAVFAGGPLVVTTDANGNAAFAFTPDPPIPAGRSVTATATNKTTGDTSEFSAAVPVTAS